ncbi:MAG: FAD-dependent monooxygenase [Candidatus Endonucleobacter bathymodioli]|uniref:FAD-dependent monooxygenase n=1 Tax=Candidatus Endonucleibacter bathymodioli TaxID=539814 RepID=A0AA90NK76_9GAMM|nr:FAD-dependent monooxygenase [Candidatus Endonucleobacter bathymodioli]
MKDQHFDVIIVGAGMIGSALAVALGSNNFKVAVLDLELPKVFKSEQLPDLRVSALSYSSEQILRQLKVWKPMQAMRMCPYRKVAVWEKINGIFGGANKTIFDAAIIHHEQLGFIIENKVIQLGIHQVMAAYRNIEFICPITIETITTVNDFQKITLHGGRHIKGRVIVGADGTHSMVRQAANIGVTQQGYEQQCLIATVETAKGEQHTTWQAFTPTGPESFLPLPCVNGKNYASIVWYNSPRNIKALKLLSSDDFIVKLVKTFPQEMPEIIKLHERGSFHLMRQHAQHYYREGIALVGDAAHTINPLAGQGVNLGLQDIAWLAEILVNARQAGEHIGNPKVLVRYEKARRFDNLMMMMVMDGFYHGFSNNHMSLKLIRNIGLMLAGRLTPGVKQVMKYAMGLTGSKPKLARGIPLA